METVNTFEVDSLKVEIRIDEMCTSPRVYDNLCVMVGTDRRRIAPDREPTTTEECALEHEHRRPGVLARYLSFSGNAVAFAWWNGGFAYVTRERCEELGVKLKDAEEQMKIEIQEYERWAEGDCYGYVILGEDGDIIDSCWGFIGSEYCEQEARHTAKSLSLGDIFVDAVPVEEMIGRV